MDGIHIMLHLFIKRVFYGCSVHEVKQTTFTMEIPMQSRKNSRFIHIGTIPIINIYLL